MSFLAPWSAIFAAAIALPLLLLLYFLRLRRQRLSVASTLLWRQAYEDLQVNAPFQRLRWSLLLILQLLALAALLLALAEPTLQAEAAVASRIVIVIDRSASMNARVGSEGDEGEARADASDGGAAPRTRLDLARDAALDMIDAAARSSGAGGGRGGGGAAQIMIVAFGGSAQVISTFSSDRRTLREAIQSIAPTDEEANLDAALQLASAFAASGADEAMTAGDGGPADVVLFSDGGVAPLGDSASHTLRSGRFRFVQIVPPQDDHNRSADESALANPDAAPDFNLGVAAFSARRDYDDPARALIFARLVNSSAQPIEVAATLAVDGEPAATLRRTIPPAHETGPGESTLTHGLDLPGGAVITLRLNRADRLPADDVAALVLPAPQRLRIALVYAGDGPDPYLRDLLDALEPERLSAMTAESWAARRGAVEPSGADRRGSGGPEFNLIIFDRVGGQRLPGVPSITFGAAPAGVREAAPPAHGGGGGQRILSWERQHPVMRGVELDTIVYTGFTGYELPSEGIGSEALAVGPQGPVLAVMRTRDARHVLVGFALGRSNWPLHVSIAVFLQNAIDYLTLAGAGQHGVVHRPGEPITVRAAAEGEVVVRGPISLRVPAAEAGAQVTLPPLRLAGLYRAEGAAAPDDTIAVSILSDVESDIRPRPSVRVNAEDAAARGAGAAAPRPLWPWLVAAAFALLALEWLVYCRKVAV